MFGQEFFPTPQHVIESMGLDCYDKVVLEPSAGKGNIVDHLLQFGAREVLACEANADLRKIVEHKCRLISEDFFTVTAEDVSHVELIAMNPPFSNADKHILHAWQIAAEGCEIVALCNWQTIDNNRGWGRNELNSLIETYGEGMNLGDCFKIAERKTGVEVGLIRLFKPRISDGNGFDEFYLQTDEEREENSVIGYNEIRAVVNTYTAAVRCFEKVERIAAELSSYTDVTFTGKGKADGTNERHTLKFGDGIKFHAGYSDRDGIATKEQFARAYQVRCWNFIFDRVGIEKYVTQGVMKDINRFINNRRNYPFTVRNIGKMLDVIIGTRHDIMNRAIVEAIDNFTRHTHENRFGVEGWKTNEGHLLNKKFITGYIAEVDYGGRGLSIRTYQAQSVNYLVDLMKALCYVTGTDFDALQRPHDQKHLQPNKWYDWGFFQFKVFKKGSGHFKFKDENTWTALNRAYAKIKGQVLPEQL